MKELLEEYIQETLSLRQQIDVLLKLVTASADWHRDDDQEIFAFDMDLEELKVFVTPEVLVADGRVYVDFKNG